MRLAGVAHGNLHQRCLTQEEKESLGVINMVYERYVACQIFNQCFSREFKTRFMQHILRVSPVSKQSPYALAATVQSYNAIVPKTFTKETTLYIE